MKRYILAVFDRKHEGFHPPLLTEDPRLASRQFTDMLDDARSAFGMNPKDYSLVQLGIIDFDMEPAVDPCMSVIIDGEIYVRTQEHNKEQEG